MNYIRSCLASYLECAVRTLDDTQKAFFLFFRYKIPYLSAKVRLGLIMNKTLDKSALERCLNGLLALCLACRCTENCSKCLRSTPQGYVPCALLARSIRHFLEKFSTRTNSLPDGIGRDLATAGCIALGLMPGPLIAWPSLEITDDLFRSTYESDWTCLQPILRSVPDYTMAQLLVGVDLCVRRDNIGIPGAFSSGKFAGQPMTRLLYGEDVDTFFALDLVCSFWVHTVSSDSQMTISEKWSAWLRLRAPQGEAFRSVPPLQRSGRSATFDRATNAHYDLNYAIRRECGGLEIEEYDRTIHLSYLSLVVGFTLPESTFEVDGLALEIQLIAQSVDFGKKDLPLSYQNGRIILLQPEAREMWLDALESLDIGLATGSPIAASIASCAAYSFASARHRGWEDEMIRFQLGRTSDVDTWPRTAIAEAFRLCFSPHTQDRIDLAAKVDFLHKVVTNQPNAFSTLLEEICALRLPLISLLREWFNHCSEAANIRSSPRSDRLTQL